MKRTILTFVLAVVAMVAMGQEKEPFFRTDSAFIVGKIVGGNPDCMPKAIDYQWHNALSNASKDGIAEDSFIQLLTFLVFTTLRMISLES